MNKMNLHQVNDVLEYKAVNVLFAIGDKELEAIERNHSGIEAVNAECKKRLEFMEHMHCRKYADTDNVFVFCRGSIPCRGSLQYKQPYLGYR